MLAGIFVLAKPLLVFSQRDALTWSCCKFNHDPDLVPSHAIPGVLISGFASCLSSGCFWCMFENMAILEWLPGKGTALISSLVGQIHLRLALCRNFYPFYSSNDPGEGAAPNAGPHNTSNDYLILLSPPDRRRAWKLMATWLIWKHHTWIRNNYQAMAW